MAERVSTRIRGKTGGWWLALLLYLVQRTSYHPVVVDGYLARELLGVPPTCSRCLASRDRAKLANKPFIRSRPMSVPECVCCVYVLCCAVPDAGIRDAATGQPASGPDPRTARDPSRSGIPGPSHQHIAVVGDPCPRTHRRNGGRAAWSRRRTSVVLSRTGGNGQFNLHGQRHGQRPGHPGSRSQTRAETKPAMHVIGDHLPTLSSQPGLDDATHVCGVGRWLSRPWPAARSLSPCK